MVTRTLSFRISPQVEDFEPPLIDILQPTSDGVTVILEPSQPLIMSGSSSDIVSGIDYVEVSIDNGQFVRATGTTNWSLGFTNVPSGPHDIKARARDKAGNYSATKVRVFNVQNVPQSGFKTFNFTKVAAAPLLLGHAEPDIIFFNGLFYMYYRNDATPKASISLATSPNGMTLWTERGTMLTAPASGWDSSEVIAPSVIAASDGKFYMYYEADNAAAVGKRAVGVAIASSPTGPFVRAAVNPTLKSTVTWEGVTAQGYGIVGTPAIMQKAINGKYYLFYHGYKDGADKVGVAYGSSPLGPWTKEPNNPILDVGAPTAWDKRKVAPSSVYVDDSVSPAKVYLLYEGFNGIMEHITNWQIGIAHGTIDPVDGRIKSMARAPNNPVIALGPNGSWDDTTVQLPSVLKVGSELWVYYSGNDGAAFRVGLAKAPI